MAPCFLAGNIPRRHLVVFFLAASELGLAAATPPCVSLRSWLSVVWRFWLLMFLLAHDLAWRWASCDENFAIGVNFAIRTMLTFLMSGF